MKLTTYLSSCPRMCSITADHVFRLYNLLLALIILTLANQILCIVFSKVTPIQSILHILPLLLCGPCLFLAQMSQVYRYGISIFIFNQRFINRKRFGKDTTRNRDIAVFLDMVEEESFDAALVEDYLMETR